MMHVFYCDKCKRYHYTNNKSHAHCCEQPMYHVNVNFTDFVKMKQNERENFLLLYSIAE